MLDSELCSNCSKLAQTKIEPTNQSRQTYSSYLYLCKTWPILLWGWFNNIVLFYKYFIGYGTIAFIYSLIIEHARLSLLITWRETWWLKKSLKCHFMDCHCIHKKFGKLNFRIYWRALTKKKMKWRNNRKQALSTYSSCNAW